MPPQYFQCVPATSQLYALFTTEPAIQQTWVTEFPPNQQKVLYYRGYTPRGVFNDLFNTLGVHMSKCTQTIPFLQRSQSVKCFQPQVLHIRLHIAYSHSYQLILKQHIYSQLAALPLIAIHYTWCKYCLYMHKDVSLCNIMRWQPNNPNILLSTRTSQ